MAKKKNYGKSENKLLYAEKKCHHCGREFYPTPHWVYKKTFGTRERITCMTAYERERASKNNIIQAGT